MKKAKIIVLIIAMIVCTACSKDSKNDIDEKLLKPDITQLRSICDLATLECYYHNVAKATKEAGTGLAHIGEKKRTFWIEYTGMAKIGIDMSKLKMNVTGKTVEITIPNAKPISYEVLNIDKSNYVASEDGWNENAITAQIQTDAVGKAQENMKKSVEENTALLARAQDRAKRLIENYIDKLGDASEIKYEIVWKYEE